MEKTLKIIRIGAVVGLMSTAACTPIYDKHGYVPSEEELAEIVVGVDTRASVESLVGQPSASGVIRDESWYYVSSLRATRGALAPKEVERQVLAISFDPDGTVANIERFGLEDGRVIALNRRVTDDNIKGVSFIRQLLGNIGNITAEQLFDN